MTPSVHPAPVGGAPQPAVELGYGAVQGCVEVFGTSLGANDRALRHDSDLDTLAVVGLAWIAFVEQFDVGSNQLLVITLDLAQLLGDVFPIVVGNLYVAA